MKDPKTYDVLMFVPLWLGIHQGILPFTAKWFGWHPAAALPLRLPGPGWWIVSVLVIAAAFGALAALDAAKERAIRTRPESE